MVLDKQKARAERVSAADRLEKAAQLLRRGGTVAFPTETVYGLGAHALDERAVARIFEIKGRPRFDPLITHIADIEQLDLLAAEVPVLARRLIDRFWPGPLTLILPKNSRLPDLVTAGLPTAAVRMPDHPVALDLIRRAGVPVAAPSANPFGATSPTCAEHVTALLGARVDLVLDGGPCSVGVESTILSLAGRRPLLLRPGGLTLEDLERAIGPVDVARPHDDVPQAPGRLVRHYAPRTPVKLLAGRDAASARVAGRCGLLAFSTPADSSAYAAVEVLSARGHLSEAAARLFAALRLLDAQGLDLIMAEPAPERGLGLAINDRLRRAASCLPGV